MVTGGLLVAREYLETERGNEVLAGIRAGAINEMSFAYDMVKCDFEEVEDDAKGLVMVRNLRECKLYDTSDVVFGMNPATVASKAIEIAPHLQAYKEKLGDSYPLLDELVNLVATVVQPDHLKEGRVLSNRNLTRLKEALATLQEILTAAEPLEDEADKAVAQALTESVLRKLAIYERDPIYLSVR